MSPPERGAHDALYGLVVTCAVFVILSTLVFAMRTVSRCFVKQVSFGWDDLLLYPGYIINVGLCVTGFIVAKYAGAGNPPADAPFITPQAFQTHLEPTLKCLYALGPLFAFGYSLPKISLLLFYLRVFIGRGTRFSIWLMMGVVIVEMLAFLIAAILYCTPVPFYWHRQGRGHCFDADTFYRVTSGIKVTMDFGLVVLPLYPLWQLQVSTLKKVGLSCVFMTSAIGLVGGLIRFVFLCVYTINDITPVTVSRLVSIIIVEPNLFFIAACLPACNSLFMEFLHRPRVRAFFHLPSTQGREGHHPSAGYIHSSRKVRTSMPDDVETLVRQIYVDEDERRAIPMKTFPPRTDGR